MAAAIPYIIAASAVVSAVSALRQGEATQAASNFNAQVAEQNTTVVREQAQMSAMQNDRETFLRLGAIRAAAGKNGGVSGEGSALDILGDAAAQGELERQNIIYQGELQARGFTNTATLDRTAGENARSASYTKAGSELLQGGANAYTANSRLART